MELKYKRYGVKSETVAAICFFLICFFKSFWYLDIPNLFLRMMMFAGAVTAFFISRPHSFTRMSKLEILWLIALSVPIMSRVFRTYEGNSIRETVGFTTFYLCSTAYAFSCIRNRHLIKASFKIISVYLGILVFCTILFKFTPQLYLQHILPLFNRQEDLRQGYLVGNMSGLTAHYSTNAIYMALAVILAACSMIVTKETPGITRKLQMYFLFITASAALLMTGKRGQLVFTVFAVITGYYFYMADKPKGRNLKMLSILILSLLISYTGYLFVPDIFSSVTRMISKMDSADVTTGRARLWTLAIEYFKNYPLAGIGFKQFLRITELDVHNIYLQFLCETGIAGTLIYISALFYTLKVSFVNLTLARKYHLYKDREDELFLLFSFMYQIFFLSYGTTGNPFYDLPALFPYMLSMGITLYYRNHTEKTHMEAGEWNTKLTL